MKQMYTAFSKPFSFFWLFLLCLSTGMGQTTNPSTGQFVVKYSAEIPAEIKASLRQEIGAEKLIALPSQRLEIWQAVPKSGKENQEAILRSLQDFAQKSPEIAYIEPDYIFSAESTPNDPLFDSQWGLNNYGQTGGLAGADIQALNQWAQSTGSDAIIAGILDTGIDWGHEDLVENIWQNLAEDFDGDGHTIEWDNGSWVLDPGDLNGIDEDGNGYVDDLIGWDFVNNDNNPFDDNGHGTHVAGIAGARGNNGKGIAGVSWQTPLMALKAFDSKGSGSVLSILPALEYARQMGAQVINNSWGGPAFSQALYDEMQQAHNEGILNIAAAGNQAKNTGSIPIYPGSFDLENVICVAATNHKDSLAVFSNFGYTQVDLGAPGQDIVSTLPGNTYGYKNGTSMATPMVTGALCLLWSLEPEKGHEQVRNMLLNSVDQLPGLTEKCATGGRLNLQKAAAQNQVFCSDYQVNDDKKRVKSLFVYGETVWAGTNAGIYASHLYSCTDTIWNPSNVLPGQNVKSLAQDSEGNHWIGTEEGLVKFDGNTWQVYDTTNSDIPGNGVEFIFVDRGDSLWISIDGQGLTKFTGNSWIPYDTLFPGYGTKNFNAITRDSAGVLWFAHNSGLCKLDSGEFTWYNDTNSPVGAEKVNCLAVDSLNQLWIGTIGDGLVRFDGSQWDVFTEDGTDLVDDEIKALTIDQDGFIWIGTPSGLNKFDGTDWILYHSFLPGSSLPSNDIRSLHTDQENNVWVGTTDGLFVFSAKALLASFTASSSACEDEWVAFQNHSIGSYLHKWYINGNYTALANTFFYKFTSPGTYEVKLVAKSFYDSDTTVQLIQILSPPTVDLGPDTSACATSMILDAGQENMEYAWKNLNGDLLGNQKLFRADSSSSYILELTSSCGLAVSDTLNVTLSGDCVWPGDVNADGQVNMLDYLSLGIAHNATGTSRTGASSQWQSEVSTDWGESFGAGHAYAANVNFKHADCDGDGTVDIVADGAVVMQNVGYSHQTLPAPIGNGIELAIEPTITTLNASDTFVIDYNINLSTSDGSPVEGVYGLAFNPRLQPSTYATTHRYPRFELCYSNEHRHHHLRRKQRGNRQSGQRQRQTTGGGSSGHQPEQPNRQWQSWQNECHCGAGRHPGGQRGPGFCQLFRYAR